MHILNKGDTGFIIDLGLYCYHVIPFVLKNAGATYEQLVNNVFAKLIGKMMEVYIDDILVKSRKVVDHVQDLSEMFDVL